MDAALAYVARYPGCFMAKIDIKAFFRHISTDPIDWPLLCSQWDFGQGTELIVDTRIPFGLRHAPEICCRFSGVVLGILRRRLLRRGCRIGHDVQVSNVVDDWLVLALDEAICRAVWHDLCFVLRELGFALSAKKLQGPCTRSSGWVS